MLGLSLELSGRSGVPDERYDGSWVSQDTEINAQYLACWRSADTLIEIKKIKVTLDISIADD